MAETTDELLARMAAKYGLPNAPAQPAPTPQPALRPAQPAQPAAPQGGISGAIGALKGRQKQLDDAIQGYADGGYVGSWNDPNLPRTWNTIKNALTDNGKFGNFGSAAGSSGAPNEWDTNAPLPGSRGPTYPPYPTADGTYPGAMSRDPSRYSNNGPMSTDTGQTFSSPPPAALPPGYRTRDVAGAPGVQRVDGGSSPLYTNIDPATALQQNRSGGTVSSLGGGSDVQGIYDREAAIRAQMQGLIQNSDGYTRRGGGYGGGGTDNTQAILDRVLTPYAGSGGQLTANQLRIAAQLAEGGADRGYKYSALGSQDQNAALDRALKGDIFGGEEAGRNARATQEWENRKAITDADVAGRKEVANIVGNDRLRGALANADSRQAVADRGYAAKLQQLMAADPKNAALKEAVQHFTDSMAARRPANFGQSTLPPGYDPNVQGYADGGMVAPSMPQVLPEVNEYRNYALAAKALGAQPVPFEQFAQIRNAARLQTAQQNQVAMQPQQPMGYARGGEVDVSGRQVFDPNPHHGTDSIPAVIDGQHPAALDSGEVVIPTKVVQRLGTKYFDDLIAKHTSGE